MKLERLEVTGFGCLRDVLVEFHPRVTVILGDNESGKSTLHRAVRAALYGLDAGGQGRAVDRSDWARWAPWSSGPYGIALTYVLDDGRRLRVARRLDTRDQGVQVLELGGSDLTDELRKGRAVIPGQFHLDIDEAVFCATAWLGDDGLRLAAPDAAPQRAVHLQEAIERLADTRRGVTAAQATARLREAIDRIGSERRTTSELGAATAKLRELDIRLEEARRRHDAVATQHERLRELETRAAGEAQRQATAEREWLAARLAEIAERRRLLDAAKSEAAQSASVIATTQAYGAFPVESEGRVITLGGELTRATVDAAEAQTRWETAHQQSLPTRRRRAEIAAGLAALGRQGSFDEDVSERCQRLRGELDALESAVERAPSVTATDARSEALRREIAATGLRSVPAGSVDSLLELMAAGRNRGWTWAAGALLFAAAGVAAGLVMQSQHRVLLTALVAAVAAFGCAAFAWMAWRRSRDALQALERVAAVAAHAGLSVTDLNLLSSRLPVLQALNAALGHEQASLSGRRAEAGALQGSCAALAQRCQELAGAAGIALPGPSPVAGAEAQLAAAREILDAVDVAVGAHRRRGQLDAEDNRLAAQEKSYELLAEHARRSADAAAAIERQLEQALRNAGMPAYTSPSEAVAAFRDACDARRRHDSAVRAITEIDQRVRAIGDEATLIRLNEDFTQELRARGGKLDEIRSNVPPDAATLRRLDLEAVHARQAAHSVAEQAREVRARLEGVLDTLPDIADLEDERDTCAGIKERGLRRLAALRRAIDLIDDASRGTHRDLAPQLGTWVGSRLTLLTDSRYIDVNVDTEHFAIALLGRDRPDMVPLELASHGTRDQVALLLRLALCEALGGSAEQVPLFLDEPLLTADNRRREMLLEFLHRVSETHQVVVTAADPEIGEAMRRISGDECALVTLGGGRSEQRLPRAAEKLGRHTARVRVV